MRGPSPRMTVNRRYGQAFRPALSVTVELSPSVLRLIARGRAWQLERFLVLEGGFPRLLVELEAGEELDIFGAPPIFVSSTQSFCAPALKLDQLFASSCRA